MGVREGTQMYACHVGRSRRGRRERPAAHGRRALLSGVEPQADEHVLGARLLCAPAGLGAAAAQHHAPGASTGTVSSRALLQVNTVCCSAWPVQVQAKLPRCDEATASSSHLANDLMM
jgi:hypothetical protein